MAARLLAPTPSWPNTRSIAADPAWPNVTPYVVLVDAKGQTQRVIGPPAPEQIKRWLAPT